MQKALKYLGHVYAGSRQKLTKKSVLDAITWHHYYMNGHTATIQDFLGLIFSMILTYRKNSLDIYKKSIFFTFLFFLFIFLMRRSFNEILLLSNKS